MYKDSRILQINHSMRKGCKLKSRLINSFMSGFENEETVRQYSSRIIFIDRAAVSFRRRLNRAIDESVVNPYCRRWYIRGSWMCSLATGGTRKERGEDECGSANPHVHWTPLKTKLFPWTVILQAAIIFSSRIVALPEK
jgi:hypothetical protein